MIARDLSDEELARRAARGEIEAFEAILARYRDRVYRLCFRWANNRDDAEDWAQECFVRAFRQLPRYNDEFPFAPWFLRLCTNTCLNLCKARGRAQARLEPLDEREWSDESALPPALLERREQAHRVRVAIETLPLPLRAAIVLRSVENLSFREISEVLEVPLQTIVTRCKRAAQLVQNQLENENHVAPPTRRPTRQERKTP